MKTVMANRFKQKYIYRIQYFINKSKVLYLKDEYWDCGPKRNKI